MCSWESTTQLFPRVAEHGGENMWKTQLRRCQEGEDLNPEVMLIEKYLSAPVKYFEFSDTFSTATSNSIYLTAPS